MRNAAGLYWTFLVALLGSCSIGPLSVAADWYEVVSEQPGPEVTDVTMRRTIEESGQPWKVRDRATGIEMVLVMPGEFLMGSPESEAGRNADEGPQHRVRLTKAFYLGATEVTQTQWKRVMGSSVDFFKGESLPADGSWDDLQTFLSKANEGIPAGVELLRAPTEAEWEYACRAGTTGPFNFDGPVRHDVMNFNDGDVKSAVAVAGDHEFEWVTPPSPEAPLKTTPAGSLPPNAWGLHDMHGNLMEWTADKYWAAAYASCGSVAVDPFVSAADGDAHTMRGGDWYRPVRHNRSAARLSVGTNAAGSRMGFRVARTLDSPSSSIGLVPGVARQATAVLVGHTKKVWHAAFSADGRRIVTASDDGTARVWDGEGNPIAVLDGNEKTVRSAMFSPFGRRIVTVADSEDHTVRVWDSEGKQIVVLAGHADKVRFAAVSPDGRRIVTASDDRTARTWNRAGKQIVVLAGHTKSVEQAVLSPDGRLIATASDDRTARVWDSEGKQLAVLTAHRGRLTHAAFSPDGSRIVTTSEDGTARLFRVPLATPTRPTRVAAIDGTALLRFGYGYMPNGMYNGGVRSILEDSNGNYWFGSWMEGVCRFDGEQLTYFTVADGLAHNKVERILEDRNGAIWFDTRYGISSYDGEQIITHTNRDYTSTEEWRLGAGDLWFNALGGVKELEGQPGVYRYDGEQFTFLAVPPPEDRDTGWHDMFAGLARGKDGRLWFATWGS